MRGDRALSLAAAFPAHGRLPQSVAVSVVQQTSVMIACCRLSSRAPRRGTADYLTRVKADGMALSEALRAGVWR